MGSTLLRGHVTSRHRRFGRPLKESWPSPTTTDLCGSLVLLNLCWSVYGGLYCALFVCRGRYVTRTVFLARTGLVRRTTLMVKCPLWSLSLCSPSCGTPVSVGLDLTPRWCPVYLDKEVTYIPFFFISLLLEGQVFSRFSVSHPKYTNLVQWIFFFKYLINTHCCKWPNNLLGHFLNNHLLTSLITI